MVLDSSDADSILLPDPGSLESTPRIIGHYQVEQTIGEGNWGKVKQALDAESLKYVALKIFFRPRLERRLKNGVARLYSEYELVKKLDHPNVIQYYELFESGQKIYMAMQLGGRSLESIMVEEKNRVAPTFARIIMHQLLDALVYLETKNVSHHDVKPANLLIDDEDHLLLCDFGVAEQYTPALGCSSFYGTPAFQPPEIAGNVSGATFDGSKADVWAAGVVLFHMATDGEYPYHAETIYLLLKTIEEDPVVLPEGVEPHLRDLLERLLDKDPERRITPREALGHPWFKTDRPFFLEKKGIFSFFKDALCIPT